MDVNYTGQENFAIIASVFSQKWYAAGFTYLFTIFNSVFSLSLNSHDRRV